MTELLNNGDYEVRKRNPTTRIELAIRTALKEAEQKEMIDLPTKGRLTPYNSLTPQIYGLPKIHKPGSPLRPIVCTVNSPTYKVAKMLAKIITPMTGHTSSFIKNSAHFVEELRKWRLSQDLMVSFDVKTLSLIILVERLQNDETLGNRTTMDPLCICHLTELCLRSTYFAFEGQIFKQIKGTAMGSPLSPVIANIFMEDFVSVALVTAVYQPTIWKQ